MDEFPKKEPVLRLMWPEDAVNETLDRIYHRRCEDCGREMKTRDLHLRLKKVNDKESKAIPLCPECAQKRGIVQDMPMKRGARSDREEKQSRIAKPNEERDKILDAVVRNPATRAQLFNIYLKSRDQIAERTKQK